jgi:hypothetical protein
VRQVIELAGREGRFSLVKILDQFFEVFPWIDPVELAAFD